MSADFWAGYISGATGIIVGNPLDLIKTRLQAGGTQAIQPASAASLRSTFDQAGTLVRGKSSMFALIMDGICSECNGVCIVFKNMKAVVVVLSPENLFQIQISLISATHPPPH